MRSPTMAVRLLEAAQNLLDNGGHSSAFRRRAVSTAYYAVFHAVDKLCADYVTHSASRTSDEYGRAYRALDHGSLKNAFKQTPLKDIENLSKIGTIIVTLQTERHDADYKPPIPGLFPKDRVDVLINMAREAIVEIEAMKVSHQDCRILATSLLFKERKS